MAPVRTRVRWNVLPVRVAADNVPPECGAVRGQRRGCAMIPELGVPISCAGILTRAGSLLQPALVVRRFRALTPEGRLYVVSQTNEKSILFALGPP